MAKNKKVVNLSKLKKSGKSLSKPVQKNPKKDSKIAKAKSMVKIVAKKPIKPMEKLAKIKAPIANKIASLKKTDVLKTLKVTKEKIEAPKPLKPKPLASKDQTKVSAKAIEKVAKNKNKNKKTETKDEDFDPDLDSVGLDDSEIAEYEDDLKAVEEVDEIDTAEMASDDDSEERDEEIYLTDSEGRRICRVRDCDQVSTVDGYCRYHYLLLWKRIQIRKSILLDGKLEKYIVDLTGRYPDKYLEAIKKDLRSEKDFLNAIQELEIDESALNEDAQEDEAQTFQEEFRGMTEAPSMDDDGDY